MTIRTVCNVHFLLLKLYDKEHLAHSLSFLADFRFVPRFSTPLIQPNILFST